MTLEAKIDRLCDLLGKIVVQNEKLLGQYEKVPGKIDEMQGQLLRHTIGFETLDGRLQHVETETEHTGSVYVGDLKEKLRKYEWTQTHWVRYAIAAGVTLLFI